MINQNGLVINKACLESDSGCGGGFTAEWGFAIHMFFNGTGPDPADHAAAADRRRSSRRSRAGWSWRCRSCVLVVLQIVLLPMLSREVGSGFGALHGVNALVLMGVAMMAGKRAVEPQLARPPRRRPTAAAA